jgi:cobalt-zinc-cadmium resistance protein CzcA
MLTRIVDLALNNRWIVASLVALLMGRSYVLLNLPIDAFPDLTNNQVIVVTECPSWPATSGRTPAGRPRPVAAERAARA